ncbi:protein RodZ, contains Xre-like HTH and DUF4115 domains [Verrucomicrobium sp. GAS474]|uniref:helix-turn-helix domain-containing protein n=1 Tax=Verrucomicrobium sp. GAS474 TaxID=1882831 RepID=UPI00087B5938|nr:RodZ domain-containing protein [Verrucomicrobium sp. GAS474]SDU26680.1 protein RodZ, contains Xre-like HTH and DUF4115 domains [Verrucomicrobium sp. GAS474]
MKSVGTQLREARHARGWTPKAAAKATKIKEQQILLLEGEEYGKFPAPAYVRGFVRIYAKTLGLNEAKVLHELDKVLAIEGEEVYLASSPVHCIPVEPRWKKLLSPRGLALLFALSVIAVVITFLSIRLTQVMPDVRHKIEAAQVAHNQATEKSEKADKGDKKEKEKDEIPVAKAVAVESEPPVAKAVAVSPAPSPDSEPVAVAKAVPVEGGASAQPSATGSAPVVAAPAAADNLVIKATDDCYVRVLLTEGGQSKELFSAVMKAGAEQHFSGQKFQLRLANPSAITAIFNGESYHSDARSQGDFSMPPGN